MMKRLLVMLCGIGLVLTASTLISAPTAGAAGCPDVEVIAARGTVEPAPPAGLTGLAFADAVRATLPGRSVRTYGVPYQASGNFSNRLAFAHTVLNGISLTQRRITMMAAACPRTRLVLSGYSQGAVVVGYALNNGISVPTRYEKWRRYVPPKLPASVAKHVAAVVFFGAPSTRFLHDIGAPPIRLDAPYVGKNVRYCIAGDTICNGAPVGQPNGLHVLYSVNGDTLRAAQFVARRV